MKNFTDKFRTARKCSQPILRGWSEHLTNLTSFEDESRVKLFGYSFHHPNRGLKKPATKSIFVNQPISLSFQHLSGRIRSIHVLIWPRLSPQYTSIVPAKLQDLRPLPSFTKSSFGRVQLKICFLFVPCSAQWSSGARGHVHQPIAFISRAGEMLDQRSTALQTKDPEWLCGTSSYPQSLRMVKVWGCNSNRKTAKHVRAVYDRPFYMRKTEALWGFFCQKWDFFIKAKRSLAKKCK